MPAQDAEVVRRLKQGGAVMIGKLNMHEFAFGMSGVISAFGPTRNPWNPERITGGSSSAQPLRLRHAVAALGSTRRVQADVHPLCAGLWDIVPART